MNIKTKIYPHNSLNVEKAANNLVLGQLVSFPTETVYGLGANAFNEMAIAQIFETKGRPKQDPLIVHVPGVEKVTDLVQFSAKAQKDNFLALAQAFWPGPITLVLPASEKIPESVTSGTGWVGVRAPQHPVALDLLNTAGVPVVAPSANLFGHVSPTRAEHVFADFHDKEVFILDGGQTSCGIESTVAKVQEDSVVVLRPGVITPEEIKEVLEKCGLDEIKVQLKPQYMPKQKAAVSPGQHVKHYSPNCPCFMVQIQGKETQSEESLKRKVILDFAGQLKQYSGKCLLYFDLSPSGDPKQASHHLFQKLREAESLEPEEVWIADLTELDGQSALGLKDRVFRSASGRKKSI